MDHDRLVTYSLPGQSVLGLVRLMTASNVPAHSSRFVRKLLRLNIFFSVAGIDECSNCDVGSGPFGSCNTTKCGVMKPYQNQ